MNGQKLEKGADFNQLIVQIREKSLIQVFLFEVVVQKIFWFNIVDLTHNNSRIMMKVLCEEFNGVIVNI